ncbi:single-stranded-DNA-specific exonuclease RecJ [Candidatus Dojkabacteria bacterium]|nr:single-stranded-DNA-specific exonuclease RecJ [Candidatus Dojkabacteria bacterium]
MARWILSDNSILEGNIPSDLSDYNPYLLQLLFNRGVTDRISIEKFLHPQISDLPHLSEFKDLRKIVDRINLAVERKEKVYIHGDYDVDGMTATAILWEYLYNRLKLNVLPYIPDREGEGYGLTDSSISTMSKRGVNLVITVDCGIRDHELIDKWSKKGIDFIVTDHHQLPAKMPDCLVLHPEVKSKKGFLGTSGAAISWILVCGCEYFKDTKNFSYLNIPGLDLVAISILSDMINSIGVNRVLLWYGLEQLKLTKRAGLIALYQALGLNSLEISSADLSYKIIPRLNSCGRIGDPLDPVRLLVADTEEIAEKHVLKINDLNDKRKGITTDLYNQAKAQTVDDSSSTLVVIGEDWPEGLVGLVAGRLNSEFNKVSVVLSKRPDRSVGSIRSISSVNIVSVLESMQELLEKFGGHDQAAGFTVNTENIDNFVSKLRASINEITNKEERYVTHNIELSLKPDEFDWKLLLTIQQLRPFGEGNQEPLIMLRSGRIDAIKIVGDSHLKLTVGGEYNYIDCIGFSLAEKTATVKIGNIVDLVGYLEVNKWNGSESLQFRFIDIRVTD